MIIYLKFFFIQELQFNPLIIRKSELPDKVKAPFCHLLYRGESCQKTDLLHAR